MVGVYFVLTLLLAVVSVFVLAAGADREPQPAVAGGYAVLDGQACLGEALELSQSGQFIGLSNGEGTLGGKLELDEEELTGDVSCVGGASAELDATVAEERLEGTLGGRPVNAELTRGPSGLTARTSRQPGSVAGEYELVPRSACLGEELALEGDGAVVELLVEERVVGEVRYVDGELLGNVNCPNGPRRRVVGTAIDRSLSLVLLPPGARLPEGAPPPPGTERISGELRREAGSVFAAFFIAVAVVVVLARLLGMAAVAVGQPRVIGEVVAGIALGPSLLGAISPDVSEALFPEDIIPYLEVAAQLGLIFYMFLIGLELDPKVIGKRRGPDRADLQLERGAADGARHRRGAPDLHAARARHRLPALRAVPRHLDVDHRVPGAGPDPRRATHAQTPDRRGGAGGRGLR